MLYGILADLTVFTHFLWIVFLVLGGLWRRHKIVRILHLSGLAFALTINVFGWYCPLTYLEVWLREKAAPGTAYAGSFIGYYLERVIYLEISEGAVFGLTVLLICFNAWLYLKDWRPGGKSPLARYH